VIQFSTQHAKPLSTDFGHFANIDINNFNWLPQNDFQFEPSLFNEYREPQDNVLSNVDLDEGFFKDAFDMDFATPYNLPITYPTPPKKKDLMAEIEAAKNDDVLDSNGQLLNCTKIWYVLRYFRPFDPEPFLLTSATGKHFRTALGSRAAIST